MQVGIIGYGNVGSALGRWFGWYTSHEVKKHDPTLEYFDELHNCEAYFVCIPVPTLDDRTLDTGALEKVLESLIYLNGDAPIFIRSTLLPGTTERLSDKFAIPIYFMPEFLTMRFADEDVQNHDLIIGKPSNPPVDLLKLHNVLQDLFPGKTRYVMSSQAAELGKYAHNCFGAIKVNYFNIVREIADKIGADYDHVLQAVQTTGFINKEHTKVPGPDGKFGFGGGCLPKDLAAFTRYCYDLGVHGSGSLDMVLSENKYFREKASHE